MAFSKPLKRLLRGLMSGTFLTTSIFFGDMRSSKAQIRSEGYLPHVTETHTLLSTKTIPAPADSNTITYEGRNSTRLAFLLCNDARTDETEDQVPDTALTLWENMQTLKDSKTIMGPALADFSIKANIFYGYSKMGNTVGLWSDYDGTVEITNDTAYSQNYRLLCQTHETIHGIQNANNIDDDDMSWSIWDFQRASMASEAAAQVGEYLMALEFYSDSIPVLMNETDDISAKVKKRLLNEWTTVQADSLPYARDLANVGKSEFYTQFKDQWWMDFYNDWTLNYYIKCMGNNSLSKPSGKSYSLESARKAGYISPDFNFTAGIDSMPSNLFGTNTHMKQAFDYVECVRLRRTLGDTNFLYLSTAARLKKEKNIYYGVNMSLVWEKLADPKNAKSALQVMDYYAAQMKKAAPAQNNSKKIHP
jgi:hypothetical protein